MRQNPPFDALQRWWRRFVPSHFVNIPHLATKLLSSRDRAAYFAMLSAGVGVAISPFDAALHTRERRRYAQARAPQKPQVFVCGAPRSGTTVVALSLIKVLPVHYFNNLTSLFPRSPITASTLFGRSLEGRNAEVSLHSFYGRTGRLFEPNDALYFWDNWFGSNRRNIPEQLSERTKDDMRRFFAAVEQYSGKPLVNKNNSLNTCANFVAESLDTARFVCLQRDPVYLAQSLLLAREFMYANNQVSYGIAGDDRERLDPIEDVCRQVMFHRHCVEKQLELVGSERFLVLSYEDFCADPAASVAMIAERYLDLDLSVATLAETLPPLRSSTTRRIDEESFARIESTLAQLLDMQNTKPRPL